MAVSEPFNKWGLEYHITPWVVFARTASKGMLEIRIGDDGTAALTCGDTTAVINTVGEVDGIPFEVCNRPWVIARDPISRLLSAAVNVGVHRIEDPEHPFEGPLMALWFYSDRVAAQIWSNIDTDDHVGVTMPVVSGCMD